MLHASNLDFCQNKWSGLKGLTTKIMVAHLALLGLLLLAAGSSATPNTCQHRADQPLMPIFHIIGNITGTGRTLSAEHINDVSAVVMHGGLYHIFNQGNGNYWDHVVSDDLIHWHH